MEVTRMVISYIDETNPDYTPKQSHACILVRKEVLNLRFVAL
jgi:hypothetical protein